MVVLSMETWVGIAWYVYSEQLSLLRQAYVEANKRKLLVGS